MSILVIVAHPNDDIIGAGGTIAKYAKKEEVHSIILSDCEDSTILFKAERISEIIKKEAIKASKILKNNLIFFGLSEDNFIQDLENRKSELKELILKLKPKKIFTHSLEDTHPSHREVCNFIKDLNLNCELYSFAVSNPAILNRYKPKLFINIEKTVILKRRALDCFKSQKYSHAIAWYSYPLMNIRDKINGLKIKSSAAEAFYKL